MKKDIFRQVALNRLSSPEQLDNLLQVTTVHGWIALGGIGLLLLTALGWSVAGRLPTKLVGQQCILVKNGGVNVVASAASGRLSDLAIEVGDTIERGQIIGRLEQVDLLQKIKAAEARVQQQQEQYAQARSLAAQSAALRQTSAAQQRQSLRHQMTAAAQRLQLLKERIATQAGLYEQGLITKQTLIASQLESSALQLETETLQTQSRQIDVGLLEAQKQSEHELAQANDQLEEARRALAQLVRDTKSATAIVSPYSGRVLELKVAEGQLLERGSALLSVESAGADMNELQAYVYLPAADGKKVAAGMPVEISPSTARREEFGFMPAHVAAVADYPSTDQGLMRVFGNDKLVQKLSGTLAPIQIQAALRPSPDNASHYAWSTRGGPPFAIQSGTSCSAAITLSEQRPIELVIPIFKKALGMN
jgi:HlyD family secretion protein